VPWRLAVAVPLSPWRHQWQMIRRQVAMTPSPLAVQ
jgi:hypothetical protein